MYKTIYLFYFLFHTNHIIMIDRQPDGQIDDRSCKRSERILRFFLFWKEYGVLRVMVNSVKEKVQFVCGVVFYFLFCCVFIIIKTNLQHLHDWLCNIVYISTLYRQYHARAIANGNNNRLHQLNLIMAQQKQIFK